MATTANWYGLAGRDILSGAAVTDWDTDTIKVALVKATYTPNQDTDEFWSTPQAQETTNDSGSVYVAGGKTLTTPTVTYDAASKEVRLGADNLSWVSASLSARYAIIYKWTGSAATSPLLGYVDFGATQTVATTTLSITWGSSGVLKIVVS